MGFGTGQQAPSCFSTLFKIVSVHNNPIRPCSICFLYHCLLINHLSPPSLNFLSLLSSHFYCSGILPPPTHLPHSLFLLWTWKSFLALPCIPKTAKVILQLLFSPRFHFGSPDMVPLAPVTKIKKKSSENPEERIFNRNRRVSNILIKEAHFLWSRSVSWNLTGEGEEGI